MAKQTLRKIQPAHKSEGFTVEQARRAWLKVEHKSSGQIASKLVNRDKDRGASHANKGA